MWFGKNRFKHLLPTVFLLFFLSDFSLPPAAVGQEEMELQLVSQTPTELEVGSTLTVVFTATHYESGQDEWGFPYVVWCSPGQALADCQQIEWIVTPIPASAPQTNTLSFPLSEAGTYELGVALEEIRTGEISTHFLDFQVPIPHATWEDAAEALQVTVSHTPPAPVAHHPTRGNDHRDPITIYLLLENTSPDLHLSPLEIGFPEDDWFHHGPWAIRELAPGDTAQIRVYPTTLLDPGDKQIDVHLIQYNGADVPGQPGHLLTSYNFTAIPLVQRTFTYSVMPDEGDHGDSFTFYSNYSSADDQPPQSVTLVLDGEEYPMARDPSYTEGMMYTYETTLDYGTHIYHSVAQVNPTEEIRYSSREEVLVSDPIPPTVGGPSGTDSIRPPGNHIILEGTGADVGSGVKEVQSRLLPGGDWEGVFWDDLDGWRVRVDSPIDDQEVGEFTVEVRAIDNEGNETPADQYYQRTVVFDFRHPKVAGELITRATSETSEMAGLHDGPPEDLGPPRMGEPYLIALKVENTSPQDQEFSLEWRERDYGDVEVDWGLDMDEAHTVGFSGLSIPGGATKWVWMPFEHAWSWIPEKDWIDLISIFIDAYDGDNDTNEFVEWAHTKKHLVSRVFWSSVPGDGVHNLFPLPYSILVEIEVSPSKKEEFYSSYNLYLSGFALTGVGGSLSMLPFPANLPGIAMLVAEAGFLVASHFSYLAAYDPSPDFRDAVQSQEVRVPELEQLDRDDPLRKGAEASLRFASNAKAAAEAYIRYLGAKDAGDDRSAWDRAQEAASFARVAAEEVEAMSLLAEFMVEKILGANREEREAMMAWGKDSEIPEIERRIFGQFGLSQKDYEELAKPNPKVMMKVLDSPEILIETVKGLEKNLTKLAELMEQAAGGGRRR